VEIAGQTFEHGSQHSCVAPVLKPSMHRLVSAVTSGQILPRRSGAQNPQNPIDRRALVFPRSSSAIRSYGVVRNELFDALPLDVG
jgi:hypothetical protein